MVNHMNFGDAIAALKQGKYVSRHGWNGNGMHIYLEDQFKYVVRGGALAGESKDYAPCIVMFTAHGQHQPGWLASQADILADDWYVVEDK